MMSQVLYPVTVFGFQKKKRGRFSDTSEIRIFFNVTTEITIRVLLKITLKRDLDVS